VTALLDAQAGVQYEGETADPSPCPHAAQAVRAWNHLSNGMGGIDWQGLDAVTTLLQVADEQVELLLVRLLAIKTYKPPGGAHG